MVNVSSDAGAPNVVPGELKCRFNLRYSNVWTHDTLAARVETLLKELGIDYELRWRVAGKPFLTQPGRLTAAVQMAVREATGLEPELSTSGGTSDGRFIAPYGIDVVELGPINATIHKINEVVSIADLERLERIYFRIAELLLVEDVTRLSAARERRASRETRDQLAPMTRAPSATNQMKTQAGMLRPRNSQLTTAHSPEPVKIMRRPPSQPNASMM